MKKFGVCFLTFFALLLIAVPVALAAGGVTNLQVTEPAQVKPMQGDKTTPAVKTDDGVYKDAKVFHITAPAQAGGGTLYLVLIHSGEKENQLPTQSSIFYIDLLQAKDGSVTGDAYPQNLVAGKTYHIEITDYANSGKLKEIATFSYAGGEVDSESYTLGDVDGVHGIEPVDAMLAARIALGLKTDAEPWQKLAADVDKKEGPTPTDAMLIARKAIFPDEINFEDFWEAAQ